MPATSEKEESRILSSNTLISSSSQNVGFDSPTLKGTLGRIQTVVT